MDVGIQCDLQEYMSPQLSTRMGTDKVQLEKYKCRIYHYNPPWKTRKNQQYNKREGGSDLQAQKYIIFTPEAQSLLEIDEGFLGAE